MLVFYNVEVLFQVDLMFVEKIDVFRTKKLHFHNIGTELGTLNIVTRWSYLNENLDFQILFFLDELADLLLEFFFEN